ncbi:DNA methyltransferase [Labrys okinawensis]|uniref:DNA methyltransferase n=1 Tax=Labrys okinawensis TaxID=346911 RepID=UPI0039BC73B1
MNKLYFGDNIIVLREHIKDESVDLIYLDPPFNSNATYNVLFREHGTISEAQVEPFRDTWQWFEAASIAMDEVIRDGNKEIRILMPALYSWLGRSPMMAYLVMMAARLIELRAKLKNTGSLYLHCDPTASHYLKLILDAIFGQNNFVAEIIWKRTNSRGTKGRWPRIHDVILCYSSSESFKFNSLKIKADKSKLPHTLITGSDGEKYQTYELTGPGITKDGESGQSWRGHSPSAMGRHWANNLADREAWDSAGLIHWPKNNGFPRRRDSVPFQAEAREVVVGDVWTDIDRLNQTAKERLGYPTQKPVALLERIILASSPEGGVMLDPFCGCGTSVEAAERLGRQWIGIDVTHYAVTLIEKRLRAAHPSARYLVHGRPTTLDGAYALARRDKHQFQWWASWLLGAQRYREAPKGADGGVDADLFFRNGPYGFGRIIVSVKGGEKVPSTAVRELAGTVEHEKANLGVLITLAEPTSVMRSTAAGYGAASPSAHGRLPKIQIVTVGELLEGRMPKLPPLPQPSVDVAVPRRKKASSDQLELLLPFTTDVVEPEVGVIVDPRFLQMRG